MNNLVLKIILSIVLIFHFGCNKQSILPEYGDSVITEDVDGYTRDMFIKGDSLFVVSEEDGLLVYQFKEDTYNGSISLDLLWSDSLYFADTTRKWHFSSILYSSSTSRIVVLDKFYCSYYIDIQDLFVNRDFKTLQCENEHNLHQSKLAISDALEKLEIFSLVRNKSEYGKTDVVSIYLTDWDLGDPYSTLIIDSLNYNATDMHYMNDYLFISNTSTDQNELRKYYRNSIQDEFILDTTIITPFPPQSLYSNESFLFVGLGYHGGCKIYRIDSMEEISWISKGFSVRDIFWEPTSKLLLFSCGYQGVVVYAVEDGMNIIDNWILNTSYAYTSRYYNDKIIVTTRDGIEIIELGTTQ